MGVSDTFATVGNFHNIKFYVRPSDGKIEMLPWDWDEAFRLGATSTIHPGDSNEPLRRLLTYTNDHAYFSHLYDLVTHELDRAYMDTWVNYFYTIGQQDSSFLNPKDLYRFTTRQCARPDQELCVPVIIDAALV